MGMERRESMRRVFVVSAVGEEVGQKEIDLERER